MAKYTMDSEPDENGQIFTIAKLELNNWSMPQYWEGNTKAPEAWPQAAVNSLIHLFNGQTTNPATKASIGIEDQLGWHIASLIELWSGYSIAIDETDLYDNYEASKNFAYAKYSPRNILDISELIQHEIKLHAIERADKMRHVVQQWYHDGIALYHATPRP